MKLHKVLAVHISGGILHGTNIQTQAGPTLEIWLTRLTANINAYLLGSDGLRK